MTAGAYTDPRRGPRGPVKLPSVLRIRLFFEARGAPVVEITSPPSRRAADVARHALCLPNADGHVEAPLGARPRRASWP